MSKAGQRTPPDPAATLEPIGSLRPHPRNPRKNDDAVPRVAASIDRFGFAAPIVCQRSTRTILAGHTRHKAALSLGLQEVPVRFVDLSDDDALAYVLADNRLGEIADWDEEALAEDLRLLTAIDMDPLLLGFDEKEVARLLHTPDEASAEDDAPEPTPGPPDSQPGQVYELGPHRLVCGDCRDPDVVRLLLAGRRVNLAFTSPPYASQRKYDESSGFKPIAPDDYVAWFEAVQANVREHLALDGSWFVNIKAHAEGGQRHLYVMDLATTHVRGWGWRFIDDFCWLRPGMPISPEANGRFKSAWEPVFWFSLEVPKFRPASVQHETQRAFAYADQKASGKRIGTSEGANGSAQGVGGGVMSPVHVGEGLAYPSNVIEVKSGARVVGHSAAFPVGLPDFFVRAFTDSGDVVYDPFMGSGTTLIAAAQNGRVGFGCEISPMYCDVIRRRWTRYAKEHGLDPGTGALDG